MYFQVLPCPEKEPQGTVENTYEVTDSEKTDEDVNSDERVDGRDRLSHYTCRFSFA